MKNSLRKVLLILFAAVVVALPLTGCNDNRAQFADELIPSADERGEPEGLWLYKGEYRSRTDGSDRERLFGFVDINGTEYPYEEYSVLDYEYNSDTHSVIYLLNIDGYGRCLYRFDYETKTGKYLCDAPDGRVSFAESNGLIYARFEDAGFLFDGEGNLLCDEIAGTLKNGVLYNLYADSRDDEAYASIEWYKDGYHSAVLPSSSTTAFNVEICGEYMYLLDRNVPKYAVHKQSERVTFFDIFNVTYDRDKYVNSYRNIEERFYYDGCMYVFSVVYCVIDYGDETREGSDEWYWYLHKIDGDIATLECEFGEARYGVSMGVYKNKFYFQASTFGNFFHKYYRYDPENGTLKKISSLAYHSGGIPSTVQYESSVKKNLVVGDYEFYVSSLMYGYSGFLNAPAGYCYYLNRAHDNKTDIMQYSFDSGYFYDDICEF